jgi:hypothetical protein
MFIFAAPPSNWQDFQVLIGEVARVKYDSDSVQEYGRQGQAQHGIDVYAEDFFGKKIGIQCKETKTEALTAKIIDREINEAKNFRPNLDLWIIATTERIDKKLQDYINKKNDSKTEPFKIQIWFWDDINTMINRSTSVMSSWYKSFLDSFGKDQLVQHLSVLRTAFDRAAFVDNFLHERNYDDFESALVDTKALIKTGYLYDRWKKNLVSQTMPVSMIGDDAYKKFVSKIEISLEKLYQAFLREKKKAEKNANHLMEVAGIFNIARRPILHHLNQELERNQLVKIEINY